MNSMLKDFNVKGMGLSAFNKRLKLNKIYDFDVIINRLIN